MSQVMLKNLSKTYDHKHQVLKGIDLHIHDGEFLVFVGPSGCGKSTLLRMIAGLEDITGGELYIGDTLANDIHASQRGIAMVFQSYALYPHMSVHDNMAFALKLAGNDAAEVETRVQGAARILQIGHLLQRKPKALSGGQRQRVAIGRAIVREPEVFLFDEPLSNLDASLRLQMRVELARLHEELGTTMIYVTHDQVEAMTLGDRIVVFNAGHIEQVGTPLALYNEPANVFVAGFLGSPRMNLLPVFWQAQGATGAVVILAGRHRVLTQRDGAGLPAHAPLTLGIRPEHIDCVTANTEGAIPARVDLVEHLGDVSLGYVEVAEVNQLLVVKLSDPQVAAGERIYLRFQPEQCHLFDQDERALLRVTARAAA